MKIHFSLTMWKLTEQVSVSNYVAIKRFDQCNSYHDLPLNVSFMFHYGGNEHPGMMQCKFKEDVDWEIDYCLRELEDSISFDEAISQYLHQLMDAKGEAIKRALKKGISGEYCSAISEVIDCICRSGEYSR